MLKNHIKVEDNKKEELCVPHKTNLPHKDIIRKSLPSISNHTIKYQMSLFGYYYSCNGFGHKAMDCIKNIRGSYIRDNKRNTHGFSRRNYNSFSPLLNYNIICYNCNNYGNTTKLCRSDLRKKLERGGPNNLGKKSRTKGTKKGEIFIYSSCTARTK
jgi:hypothetical protein